MLPTVVRQGSRCGAWNTIATLRRGLRTGSPSIAMEPAYGSMPAMQLSSVLLPDPDGPMTINVSPGWTSRLMLSRTGRAPGANVLPTEVSDTCG